MKKILFVVDERIMGGVSILLEDILNSIDLNNKEIDVLVLHDRGERLADLDKRINVFYGSKFFSAIDYTIKDALKTKNLATIFNKIRTVFYLKTGLIKNKIKKERRKILKKDYDMEIAFKDAFPTLFTAMGDSPVKIAWLHSDYKIAPPTAKYHNLFVKCYEKIDKIIAVSNGVRADFNNVFKVDEKVSVISNMINAQKIEDMKNLGTAVKKHEGLRMVTVGRLHSQKGYDNLLKALNMLNENKELESVSVEIYGDGPEKEKLQNLSKQYNLENIVSFEEHTSNPFSAINGADLFLLSSIYEPFGLVIVEAMLLGIPVLATENSATGELIDNEINGKIVENSVEGLYLGLKDLIINQDKIKKYKTNLKEYTYDNSKIISEIENLLK